MPGWNDVVKRVAGSEGIHSLVRKEYLDEIYRVTERNVVLYYSSFLERTRHPDSISIDDTDINGFMNVFYGLREEDRKKGVDLILHTPGGGVAATQAIIHYLSQMFKDIRVIVPQLAMSGGTMIACCAGNILMGKHSYLGPVDPQLTIGNKQVSALDVINEFKRAKRELHPNVFFNLRLQVLAMYGPGFMERCLSAIKRSREIVRVSLGLRMFSKDDESSINEIVNRLTEEKVYSHDQRFSAKDCQEMGLKITMLETNHDLQEAVLSLHHACLLTFQDTDATKIIERHGGASWIRYSAPA